jgi:hypothetical protein
LILALDGDDPVLVPDTPPEQPAPAPHRSRAFTVTARGVDNRAARAAAYMSRLPNLGEGQGRDDVAYQFACFLVRDLSLSKDVALDWLIRWDAGNTPPKGKAEMEKVRDNALCYGRRAIGCGLTDTSSCRLRRQRQRGHYTLTIELGL